MSWRRALLPSPTDIVFLLFLLSVPLVRGHQAINTDGDLGRHIRVGETILAEGALPRVDRFSHTMAGQPFVPHEWLSEVAFAGAYRLAGVPGVLLLTALVLAGTYAAIALFLQRSGVGPLAAFGVAVAAGLVGAVHWLARPHIFTVAGAVATLWLLERGGRRSPWAMLALFALWANLHGGFLYGLALIGLFVAGDLLEVLGGEDRTAARDRLRLHALGLAAAVLGACLNPAGPALLPHVAGYLGKGYLVDRTAEYQSPDFHLFYGRLFLAVLCGVIAALALAERRPAYPRLLTILANVAFALMSLRNIPLFGVVALPLAALHLAGSRIRWPGGPVRRMDEAFRHAAGAAATGPWRIAAAGALAVAAVALARAGPGRTAGFDPAVFPVQAVAKAREAGLAGNLFNEFAWGGYILLAWPGQRVFIDGQTDFYGEPLTREYVAIRNAEPGWAERLERREVRLVILPPDAPLAQRLRSRPGWELWSADPTADVLVRTPR
jgi:hypothetical protein